MAIADIGVQAAPNGPAWTDMGPTAIQNGQLINNSSGPISGSVTSLALHPTNTAIAYAGTNNGGVWKTVDGGNTWRALTDDQPSLAIGALAVDPVNPDVVYAGTGEALPNTFCFNYYGAGLLKSTDGGLTWSQLGEAQFGLRGISSIAIDPTDTNILYVATGVANFSSPTLSCQAIPGVPQMGLFKSLDGGATFFPLFFAPSGVDRVVIDPTPPLTLYVSLAANGLFKSTDGGWTYTALTIGVPPNNFGRTNIAVDLANPSTVYAAFNDFSNGGRVFRSLDGGSTFTELAGGAGFCNEALPLGNQCYFSLALQTAPGGPLLVGGFTKLLRSIDSGATFAAVQASGQSIGVGVRAIEFHPANADIVWVGTEGGVWRSNDRGATWVNRNTNQSTFSFISIAAHPTSTDVFIGGTHLGGTLAHQSGRTWTSIRGGNGGMTIIDPSQPTTYYHTFHDNNLERSEDAGATWTCKLTEPAKAGCTALLDFGSFYIPLEMDASVTSRLYLGTFRVYRSNDRGDTFTPISPDLTAGASFFNYITAVSPAPTNSARIYAATIDSRAWVTSDGGANWILRTAGLPTGRGYTGLAVDPIDSATAYLTASGFGSGHLFKTTDAGVTWSDVSGTLPDVPALCVQAVDPATLFVGTDIGVMVTHNGGGTWSFANTSFPRCATFDIAVVPGTNRVLAATHGRGVFSNQFLPTLGLTAPVSGSRIAPGSTTNVQFSAHEGLARPFFATIDVDLSSDGGTTFAVPVATGLSPSTTGFAYAVPSGLRTPDGRLRVRVRDTQGGVVISVVSGPLTINTPPVVRISAPASALPKTQVTLDASGSSDADGDALTYRWTQTAGEPVSFDASSPAPTFTAPDTERNELSFALQVSDGTETSRATATVLVALTVLPAGQRAPGCATRGPAGGTDPFWLLMLAGACAGLARRRRAMALAMLLAAGAAARAGVPDVKLSRVLEHPEIQYLFGVGSYHPKSSRSNGEVQYLTALRLLTPDRWTDDGSFDGFEISLGYTPTLFDDILSVQVGALRFSERTKWLRADHHFFYGAGGGTAIIERRFPEARTTVPEAFLTTGLSVRHREFAVEGSVRGVFGFRPQSYNPTGVMVQVMGAYFFEL